MTENCGENAAALDTARTPQHGTKKVAPMTAQPEEETVAEWLLGPNRFICVAGVV